MPDIDALIRAQQGDPSGLTGPAPAAVGAVPQVQNDIATILPQLFAMPQIAQPRSEKEMQLRQLEDLNQQRADLPVPQTGPKNLALRILSATRPGAAISDAVYGPGVQRYKAQTQSIADQIANLKEQSGISESESSDASRLASTAGMAGYRSAELGEKTTHDRATEANSTARTQAYTSWHNSLQQIMQGNLDLKTKALAIHQQLGLMGIQVQQDRNNVILSLGGNRMTLDANKFNADVANGNQSLLDQIEQGLGLKQFFGVDTPTGGTTSVQPVTPGSAQPFPTPAKSAPTAKSPTPVKGKVLVEQPDGTFK